MAAPRPDATAAHPALAGAPAPARDSTRVVPAARAVVRAEVTRDAVDPADLAREVERAAAGAVVTFSGVVRDHDLGRAVTGIEYVAHPSAPEVMAAVVADVAARSDVDAVAAVHRVGQLGIGDCALAVAVAAAHRAEAFEAAAALVDAVKERLPVWKRQEFPDGTDEWVACP